MLKSIQTALRALKYVLIALFCLGFLNSNAQSSYMLAGTYRSPSNTGIHVYKFDEKKGTAIAVSNYKLSNPSFLCVSPDEKFVFAVEENSKGSVVSLRFNKNTGSLELADRQSSGGADPCHVEIDHSGRWLFVSNYSSGSLSVFSIDTSGKLALVQSIQHKGKGTDTSRQKGPHVHGAFISKDNRHLYVTDLGLDKVFNYPFDPATGKLGEPVIYNADPASGPRAIALHPYKNSAFLLEELSGTVVSFSVDTDGSLKAVHTVSTLKPGDHSRAGSADIHVSPDGHFLYASNRMEVNDIAIYKLDPFTNEVRYISSQPVMGRTPRNFSIDPSGKFLLCEDQNSDIIVVFKRNKRNGTLKDTGNSINLGKPVCIKWINSNP